MSCPAPELLLRQLTGENGPAAQKRAEAHIQTCAGCRAGIEGLVTPDDEFVQLLDATEPIRAGNCPVMEDLACWCAGDPLSIPQASHIANHLLVCEACSLLAAQLKLDLSGTPISTPARASTGGTWLRSVSTAPVIAQIFGTIALLAAGTLIVLSGFESHQPKTERSNPSTKSRQEKTNAAPWPFQAVFDFRPVAASEQYHLTFPHRPALHLSADYEYAVRLTSQRAGWALLYSAGPDRHLTALNLGRDPTNSVLPMSPGESVRFPPQGVWEELASSVGKYQLYAVYLPDRQSAQRLAVQSKQQSSEKAVSAFVQELDDMVVKNDCSLDGRPCVLTFEYSVY